MYEQVTLIYINQNCDKEDRKIVMNPGSIGRLIWYVQGHHLSLTSYVANY